MIEFIFYGLNFLTLIGLAIYLFKRYALPVLRQEIAFETLQQTLLHKRCHEIKKRREHFEAGYQFQEDIYQDLSEKIVRWHKAVQAKAEQYRQERLMLEQVIHARRKQQIHDQRMHELQAQVMPKAVRLASRELHVICGAEKDLAYRTRIVDYMRRTLS